MRSRWSGRIPSWYGATVTKGALQPRQRHWCTHDTESPHHGQRCDIHVELHSNPPPQLRHDESLMTQHKLCAYWYLLPYTLRPGRPITSASRQHICRHGLAPQVTNSSPRSPYTNGATSLQELRELLLWDRPRHEPVLTPLITRLMRRAELLAFRPPPGTLPSLPLGPRPCQTQPFVDHGGREVAPYRFRRSFPSIDGRGC
jgi:hypothetical protein